MSLNGTAQADGTPKLKYGQFIPISHSICHYLCNLEIAHKKDGD
jgi:hypothetical protein